MREIRSSDIMHIGFLKKECFTGSSEGMRYRMERFSRPSPEASGGNTGFSQEDMPSEEETALLVTVWPEPYAYSSTPREKRTEKLFSFDEAGIEQALEWLNQEKHRDWAALRLKEAER